MAGITLAQFGMLCARRFRDGGNQPLPLNASLGLRINLVPVAKSSPRDSKSGVKFLVTIDMQPFASVSDPFGYQNYFEQSQLMANNGTPKHLTLEAVINLVERSGVAWSQVELRIEKVGQYAERYSAARQAGVIERFEANELSIVSERQKLYAYMLDAGLTSVRAQKVQARLAQIDALIAMGNQVRQWAS